MLGAKGRIRVSIANRQRRLSVNRRQLRQSVSAILQNARIEDAEIGVAVVNDAAIAQLHADFLHDPEPTDVLSFVLESSPARLEAEIVVSADAAAVAAPRFGATAQEELLRYVIHGALHIVGFDDLTPRKRAAMKKQEQKYLSQAGR